jgi:hypothetical protein
LISTSDLTRFHSGGQATDRDPDRGAPASPGKRTLVETYGPAAAPCRGPAAPHPAFDPAQRLVDGVGSGQPPSKGVDPGCRDLAEAAAQGIGGGGVVQQRGGVQLKGGVGEVGDAYEQHADAVADAVMQGKSAEGLLDQHSGGAGATRAVQRDTGPGSRSAQQQEAQQSSRVDRLIHLLTATPVVSGPEEYDEAYAFLAGLSMPDLLATMSGAADRGYLPQLIARSGSAAAYGRARLLSALYAVELARVAPSSLSNKRLHQAGVELDQIPQDQQLQVLDYLLHRRGTGVSVTAVLEGVVAMRAEQIANLGVGSDGRASAQSAAGMAGAGPVTTAGTNAPPVAVEPGPWALPGDQPIPFYIGNQAHRGIAAEYVAAHVGDRVIANFSPISSILVALRGLGQTPNAGALNDTELGLMPDISNLTRLHLYEIKPVAGQALGAAKATMCAGLFSRAGIAMQLGPMTEPGTAGGIPAPDGVYMFWSPEPGVIVYQYRKGRLVPVPVLEPEPVRVRRWRFELQPMSQQQQQAIATLTFGGTVLLIAMILLSPAGI